jgi:hypothetical protein
MLVQALVALTMSTCLFESSAVLHELDTDEVSTMHFCINGAGTGTFSGRLPDGEMVNGDVTPHPSADPAVPTVMRASGIASRGAFLFSCVFLAHLTADGFTFLGSGVCYEFLVQPASIGRIFRLLL